MVEFYKNLSPSIKSVIIITFILLIIIFLISLKLRKYDENTKPKGIMIIIEFVVQWANNLSKECFGKKWKSFASYITTLAIYLTFANLCGLIGLTPPTMNFSVTLALALVTFIFIEVTGIKSNGFLNELKGLFEPIPILFPINVIGEIATPFSMAARLFGNILSGLIITTIIYSLLGWVAVFVTPPFHAIFDIVFGMIQTIVFCTLTAVFIANKIPENELIKD